MMITLWNHGKSQMKLDIPKKKPVVISWKRKSGDESKRIVKSVVGSDSALAVSYEVPCSLFPHRVSVIDHRMDVYAD